MTDADLAAAAALAALGTLLLAALHRPLVLTAFDRDGAAATGCARRGSASRCLALLAVAIAVAVQGLGALLVLAVLVAPAVAVRRHARTPGAAMLARRAAVAVLAGVVGI